jgi:hypothetical protein
MKLLFDTPEYKYIIPIKTIVETKSLISLFHIPGA